MIPYLTTQMVIDDNGDVLCCSKATNNEPRIRIACLDKRYLI